MKKILSVLTIIFLSVLFAYAADEDTFSKMDKNKDGKVSKQEYMDAMSEKFDKIDKNHDKILTKEEIRSSCKVDAEKLIKEINPNSEEKIIKKMYMQAAEKQFKSIDKNQDGYIDIKEWKIFRSQKNPPALVIFTF
jgi:Ca2+-binding EF-hand superfamily protein